MFFVGSRSTQKRVRFVVGRGKKLYWRAAIWTTCARGALPINADARVRIATLREGTTEHHVLPTSGLPYLVADHGRLYVGHVRLAPRVGVVVSDERQLTMVARDDTDVVIVELLR
ncbi:hypothetical protein [Cupriavidus sp. L7L]|uniref:pirin family protein n=1 Tax=Cupriavidus sp. L7L TaxID=2546443 RepID=UPI001FB6FDC5|nr:hypothetical protein [Cupriavidus sp. L7L]